jgi:hypothetical protein
MRIALDSNFIPAYVPPVPVVPLSTEASKALIANGVFDQNPNHVFWTAPGQAPANLGGPIGSAASGGSAGGLSFQPRRIPKSDDSLLTVLLDVGNQALPFLEQGETHGVAEGVAFLVATPDILRALTSSDRGKAENLVLYGTNAVSLLKIANQFAQIPHVDTSLAVVAGIFKIGEQVFITGAKEHAAG